MQKANPVLLSLGQSGYSLPCPLKAVPKTSGLLSEKLHPLPCIAGISAIACLGMNWKLLDQQSEKLYLVCGNTDFPCYALHTQMPGSCHQRQGCTVSLRHRAKTTSMHRRQRCGDPCSLLAERKRVQNSGQPLLYKVRYKNGPR